MRFADTHVRINLDMLGTRHRELLLVGACIEGKTRFVVDNMNITRDDRARYIGPAKAAGFPVVGYYLRSDIESCLARNEGRSAAVPVGAVRAMRKRLELPALSEGFDELFYVRQVDAGFSVREWSDDVPSA